MFEQLCTPINFERAFYEAVKGKKDHPSCVIFCSDLQKNLECLRQDVFLGRWQPWGYNTFMKYDGNKIRRIDYDPEFSDNIVQHAIAIVLLPLFKKTAIRDTYSGIKGRGLHDGVVRIRQALQTYHGRDPWIVKLDIHHFYQNVDIKRLKKMLARRIKDKAFLQLLFIILDSHPNGLPIGNYLSQHFANFFLSDLDHYMKERAKCKHYFRYCDDIVVIEPTKQAARDDLFLLEHQLALLGLTVKANKQVFPISRPGHLDFLGYVFYKSTIRIRRSIERDFRKAAASFCKQPNAHDAQSLMSYYGWLRWTTAGYKLWNALLPGVNIVKYSLPSNTANLKDAINLTDLAYRDGTMYVPITELLDKDIIVVASSVFKNERQESVLRFSFFYPLDEQPYRTYTQSKVLMLLFNDITKGAKQFEPFKTRITRSKKCFTIAPTETI